MPNQNVSMAFDAHAERDHVVHVQLKLWPEMERLLVVNLDSLRSTTCSAGWIGDLKVTSHRRPSRRPFLSVTKVAKSVTSKVMEMLQMFERGAHAVLLVVWLSVSLHLTAKGGLKYPSELHSWGSSWRPSYRHLPSSDE